MKSIFIWLFVLILIAFGALYILSSESKKEKVIKQEVTAINYVKINDTIIEVDIASSDVERARGLSGRVSLGANSGMLFVFDGPGKNMFWMKDMNFPIDIIWLDENKKIIYIKENLSPKTYPEVFGPEVPSMYVLEVNSNFTKKYNIKIGDIANFF